MPRAAAIAAAAAVVAGLAAGAWFAFSEGGRDDRFAECRATSVAMGGGDIGGPFELVNQNGEAVTDKDVIDGPTLVYFGYTYCPDVCPVDMVRNADAVDILAERGIEVTPVFITIDPQRDTPDAVADFVANLHPRMIGLTGDAEAVDAAKRAYKAYSAKVGDDPSDYLMDHSTFTYLMAPEEGFLDVFRRDMPPEAVADAVQCYAERL